MERINRRRSTGGCIPTAAGSSASSSNLQLQGSSPRLRAAFEDGAPARRRAPSPQDRNGLAAAARLAAASSGDHPTRSARPAASQIGEKNRRHSGQFPLPGGCSPPLSRHAWRFTAASSNDIPPATRSPQTQFREVAPVSPPSPTQAGPTSAPSAAAPSSPQVHERRLRDDSALAQERRHKALANEDRLPPEERRLSRAVTQEDRLPVEERRLSRAVTQEDRLPPEERRLSRAVTQEDTIPPQERRLSRAVTQEDMFPLASRRFSRASRYEEASSYAPTFKAPDSAAVSDAASEIRSYIPSFKAPEPAIAQSDVDARASAPLLRASEPAMTPNDATSEVDVVRPRLTRAQSVLRTTKAPEPARARSADPRRRREREDSVELVAPVEDLPARRPPQSNSGAKTERQSSRIAEQLTTASSALSSSLRKPAPFKTLPSCFGGRYQVGRYLGRGASATVWEAAHSDSSMRVAVKVFDQGSRDKKQAHRELRVLSRVQHPSVLEAMEVVETSLYSQLVTELLDGESLRAYTQRQPNHRLEESAAQNLYQQVVEGISFCHDRLVVHRDLKLENLLLDKSAERVKIIDFGFATQVATRSTKLRAFCGTPSYMAPEIVKGESYSGFATDVWALGVVVFALLAGSLPFTARTEMQLYAKIRRGIFSIPDSLGESVRRLVRAMMRLEASSRPSAAAVLRQSWVCGMGASASSAATSSAATSSARKSFAECHVESQVCLHRDKENIRRSVQWERPESPAKYRAEFTARRRSLPGNILGGS